MCSFRYLFCVVLCACVLAACDTQERAAYQHKVDWLSHCPDFAETGKALVEQNAECGFFSVKENPADAQSEMIRLNVMRLPAVNPVPEPDPLFIVAGGPGQSAVGIAMSVRAIVNDVRKNRDIVFVDQRGTGKSNPIECELSSDAMDLLSEEEQHRLTKQAVQDCVKKYQGRTGFYITPYAVADLDAVRTALGYKKINLWGGSYGSRVVLEYMREFPVQTRTGILDGVAPAAIALPWAMEKDGLAALAEINQQCQTTPACLAHYGDIIAKANEVSERLLHSPETISIPHPRTQEQLSLRLTAQDFASVLHLALYNRDLSRLLPKVISDAAARNYQLFGSLIYLAKSKSELSDINVGMHYFVVCNEDFPLYKEKDPATTNVFFHSRKVQHYHDICSEIPPAQMPESYWAPVTSDAPVLMLSGQRDPVTPPYWAESVKAHLTNAVHVVAPGGHHIISGEGCVAQIINEFIVRGNGRALNSSCANNIKPSSIYLPPYANKLNTTADVNDAELPPVGAPQSDHSDNKKEKTQGGEHDSH